MSWVRKLSSTRMTRRLRRSYDKRVDQCEDRMAQLQKDMQKEIDKQVAQLQKVTKERHDAQEETNESKRYESKLTEGCYIYVERVQALRVGYPAFSVRSSSGEQYRKSDSIGGTRLHSREPTIIIGTP